METFDKSAAIAISAVFNTIKRVDSRSVFWNRGFRAFT